MSEYKAATRREREVKGLPARKGSRRYCRSRDEFDDGFFGPEVGFEKISLHLQFELSSQSRQIAFMRQLVDMTVGGGEGVTA
jgi:hypothetical protein